MPHKLTATTEQLLCEAIKAGMKTDIDIARYARINASTLQNWRKLAPTDARCQRLVDAMERAWVDRKVHILANMERAGYDDWRMWREMIAITDPQNYGKEQTINANMTGDVSVVLTWGDGETPDAHDGDAADAA